MDINRQIPFYELTDTLFRQNGLKVFIIRLDTIHTVVSGNKIFKLHYFIKECLEKGNTEIRTYGGAYSNHLIAAAFAAKEYKIPITGIVRGEIPSVFTDTLQKCIEYGMTLEFVSRNEYQSLKYEDSPDSRISIIPEGGYHPLGALGASLIIEKLSPISPTHVVTAAGSATTTAGLLIGSDSSTSIISVAVLKNCTDMGKRMDYLSAGRFISRLCQWDYPFGGFAKYSDELLLFMNSFYDKHGVPLDFVYTAKMMYGVLDKIKEGYFPEGSRIACLHTGGLQGNCSIQKHLIY